MRKAILATVFLLAVPTPVFADQMTVSDLQAICAGRDAEATAACKFYILGAVDGAVLGEGRKTAGGPLCIAPASSERLIPAVKAAMAADLKAFPRDRTLVAAGFVLAAAMRAFPCHK